MLNDRLLSFDYLLARHLPVSRVVVLHQLLWTLIDPVEYCNLVPREATGVDCLLDTLHSITCDISQGDPNSWSKRVTGAIDKCEPLFPVAHALSLIGLAIAVFEIRQPSKLEHVTMFSPHPFSQNFVAAGLHTAHVLASACRPADSNQIKTHRLFSEGLASLCIQNLVSAVDRLVVFAPPWRSGPRLSDHHASAIVRAYEGCLAGELGNDDVIEQFKSIVVLSEKEESYLVENCCKPGCPVTLRLLLQGYDPNVETTDTRLLQFLSATQRWQTIRLRQAIKPDWPLTTAIVERWCRKLDQSPHS